ncbi:DNA-binding response regulator [Nocardioides sp. NPDC059952]|uniref:DNA-binding response regulator n=1 Tax=Nocardioides sp. NPDC059952 TaxID=3347014 RepID=UPI003649BE2B
MTNTVGTIRAGGTVAVVRGEEELVRRTSHLFAAATDIACAAIDLRTWSAARTEAGIRAALCGRAGGGVRLRKVYRPNVLLDPVSAAQLREMRDTRGAQIRITPDEINETILIDRRVAILAGDRRLGERSFSIVTQPEVVQGVTSLFDAAWRSATSVDAYDARIAELRDIAPQVLDLLGRGVKDEAAARTLGLGVRTYRRRVAELMEALGASSRFQAGVRARELGLV